MGDNRNNSVDSKSFGPVSRNEITNLVITWWKMPFYLEGLGKDTPVHIMDDNVVSNSDTRDMQFLVV